METLESVNEKTRRAWDLAAGRYHELFHDEMSRKPYDLALLDAFASRFGAADLVLDAGCGPCASAGRVLFEKGIPVVGVDLSERCVALARAHHPGMRIERADLTRLPFPDRSFRAVLSYYSILDTPKRFVPKVLSEFRRVLSPYGSLLLVVKEGDGEGWQSSLLGIATEVYVSSFSETELRGLLEGSGFAIESLEAREPYESEIAVKRIYATARVQGASSS